MRFIKHNRRSIRLLHYDYSTPGYYFVTICTYKKYYIFGEIIDGKMVLSKNGCFVEQYWSDIPEHYPNVKTDAFTVMPNHVHGILIIGCDHDGRRGGVTPPNGKMCIEYDHDGRRGGVTPPLHETFNGSNVDCRAQHVQRPTLGQIIGYYKYQSTKQINETNKTPTKRVWQRNYYEHIIRNDIALNNIRKYIIKNPTNWETDRNNQK